MADPHPEYLYYFGDAMKDEHGNKTAEWYTKERDKLLQCFLLFRKTNKISFVFQIVLNFDFIPIRRFYETERDSNVLSLYGDKIHRNKAYYREDPNEDDTEDSSSMFEE